MSETALSVLVKQYAFDLRHNASGGDDYPYEYARATADYLEELIKRAKGNCTCARAGFPDSCDNCDGLAQTPAVIPLLDATRKLLITASLGSCTCNTKSPELMWHALNCRYVTLMMALENVEAALSDTLTDGCICQDQHRRGYCTEPGCPYSSPEGK